MNLLSPQPTPLDLRWRMFGIPVRVHPTFWLFSWVFSYLYRPAPNWPIQYIFLFIGVMFFAVLWRELGRALVGKLFGHKGQVVLYGMGGMAIGDYERAHRWQRIAIHLAGPASGFFLCFLAELFKEHLLHRIAPAPNGNNLLLWRGVDLMLFETFLWNAMNLLPVIPLDGGHVMRELVTGMFRKKGLLLSLLLSMLFAVLIAVYSQSLFAWAANRWSRFWFLEHLNPLVTAIFFGIYALMNFFSLVGEIFSKSKEPAKSSEDEFPDVKREDDGDYPR